ncbi:MAG: pyruvate carboxyltransferase [Desulfobacterales bacterium]|nr:pyruvate carboxyltransferase [Desulfobacterales bacterium]
MKGLVDSTLREGQQRVNVFFTLAQKKEIYSQLCRVGVEEIELGIATAHDHELAELISWCRQQGGCNRLALWSRCRAEDIRLAAALKPDVLSLSIPVSDLHITKKLGKDRQWVLDTLTASLQLAHCLGFPYVSVGLEDGTRADREFLDAVCRQAEKHSARRVRLADTVGIADPASIKEQVRRMANKTDLEVGVHCHNDFGMATANALHALESGAHWADVTVAGIGERAGNARLEEVAGYLSLRRGRAYDVSRLAPLARSVAAMSSRTIPPHQPVVGREIFTCETGLHLQGLEKDPASYEPYAPERVGARRQLRFGAKLGRRAIRDRIAATGHSLSEPQLDELATTMRSFFKQNRGSLTLAEFDILVASLAEGLPNSLTPVNGYQRQVRRPL